MKTLHSVPDNLSLMEYLNSTYDLQLSHIRLYRDMIGAVYFLREKDRRYAFKLYRAFDVQAAIQSTEIMSYLKQNGFPVPEIIRTRQNQLYSSFEMAEGTRIGVLFEYVDGKQADLQKDACAIGELTGRMHRLMEYPGELCTLEKDFYIDRFIGHMRDLDWDASKIDEMEAYGHELWSNVMNLPKGFTHGDLHTGNLLKQASGEIVVVDFDISSLSYPIFDIATICNGTNFVKADIKDLEKTHANFQRFYSTYSQERLLSQAEMAAIFDSIIIHHYELLGTIPIYRVPVEGDEWINDKFFNLHYTWVMEMREAQEKLRQSLVW